MEGFIISDTFLALPAIELRHKSAHGTIIERSANIVYTLPLVPDAVPPSLYDLVTRRGEKGVQYERIGREGVR